MVSTLVMVWSGRHCFGTESGTYDYNEMYEVSERNSLSYFPKDYSKFAGEIFRPRFRTHNPNARSVYSSRYSIPVITTDYRSQLWCSRYVHSFFFSEHDGCVKFYSLFCHVGLGRDGWGGGFGSSYGGARGGGPMRGEYGSRDSGPYGGELIS